MTNILHIIDTLGRGGAEKLLVNVVNELGDSFDNIVLYFSAPHDLSNEIKSAKVICLNTPFSVKKLLEIIIEIRKVVIQHNVSIVHSHSYWTNIVVRLARLPKVKIIQSYHNAVYDTMWHKPTIKLLSLLDRITYKKNIKLIAVSEYVKNILQKKMKYKDVTVLINFVEAPTSLSKKLTNYIPGEKLKVVSIGDVKKEKNYYLVLDAFEKDLKNKNIQYDVFGGGKELEKFRNEIKDKKIKNLQFMGRTSSVYEELMKYDLFCMTSFSEACPLSPLEAMKVNLPLLLSNIPAFKEIAGSAAFYFQSRNKNDFIKKIDEIINGDVKIYPKSESYRSILKRYSKQNYIEKLTTIYLDKE